MLYVKAETEKKANDKRYPIPYYLLGFMGQVFKDKSYDEINKKLDKLFTDKQVFEDVYAFYKKLTKAYAQEYIKDNQVDYNVMIKQEINLPIFEHCLNMAKTFEYNENVQWFIEQ